mmetsp:Transcript_5066/g.9749  ORF Transcript_5066/g.9749 Transcript_5066/m.9749 type:complete len:213 (-) Transcript_5066:2882-3520(-)
MGKKKGGLTLKTGHILRFALSRILASTSTPTPINEYYRTDTVRYLFVFCQFSPWGRKKGKITILLEGRRFKTLNLLLSIARRKLLPMTTTSMAPSKMKWPTKKISRKYMKAVMRSSQRRMQIGPPIATHFLRSTGPLKTPLSSCLDLRSGRSRLLSSFCWCCVLPVSIVQTKTPTIQIRGSFPRSFRPTSILFPERPSIWLCFRIAYLLTKV